jgi:hypothetical protein
MSDCRTDEGIVEYLARDSVALAVGAPATQMSLPLASVTRIDVHRGRKGHTLTGLIIGGLAGLGLGALVAVPNDDWGCQYRDTGALCGMVIVGGAVGGTVIGTVVGTLIRTDRWEEVPLDRLRVSFAPRRDGFAVGLSVSF